MSDFKNAMSKGRLYWLGPIVQAHTIGDFQIIEFMARDFSREGHVTDDHRFSCFVNEESTNHSYPTLDEAILGCLEFKYQGLNSQFSYFASRMLGIPEKE